MHNFTHHAEKIASYWTTSDQIIMIIQTQILYCVGTHTFVGKFKGQVWGWYPENSKAEKARDAVKEGCTGYWYDLLLKLRVGMLMFLF